MYDEDMIIPKRFYFPQNFILHDTSIQMEKAIEKLNSTQVSYEEYFGKLPVVNRITKCFARIQNALIARLYTVIDDKTRDLIRRELETIEELSEEHFNVESVTMNIITHTAEISSIPVSTGKLDLSQYEKYGDKEAMEEYSKIKIDKNGIRYIHKEGHHIIVNLSVNMLAAKQVKPEHLTAMYFHEIGHSFLQYKTGWSIGVQRLWVKIDIAVKTTLSVYSAVRSFKTAYKEGSQAVSNVKFMKDEYKKNKEIDELLIPPGEDSYVKPIWDKYAEIFKKSDFVKKTAYNVGDFGRNFLIFINCIQAIFLNVKNFWGYLFDRTTDESTKIKETRHKLLEGSFVVGKFEDLTLAVNVVVRQIICILTTAFQIVLYGFPGYVISKLMMSVLPPGVWVGKKIEKTADEIAAAYGMGPEITEALKLFRDINVSADFIKSGIFKATNNIPVVNVVAQMPALLLVAMENHISGHPTDHARIVNVHKNLVKDLEAQALNPKLKKALIEDINRVNETYKVRTDPKLNSEENNHAVAFMYYAFRFFKGIFIKGDLSVEKKPSKLSIGLHAISAWINSFDIKKILKFKPDEEKSVLEIIEGKSPLSMVEEDKYVDPLDCVVAFESPLTDVEYENLRSVTMEGYFGQTAIVKNSINYLKKIRSLFPTSGTIPQENREKIKNILKIWGKELSKEFNTEDTILGLENIYNAYALSMVRGNSVQLKAAKTTKVIETSNGIKFEKPDNIFFIISLGIRLITDPKLSETTIVAVMFHEIGHGFQHYKNESIQRQRQSMMFAVTAGAIKDFFAYALSFQIVNATKQVFALVVGLFQKFGLGKDRLKFAQELQASTTQDMNTTEFKDGKAQKPKNQGSDTIVNPVVLILSCLQSVLVSIVSVIPIPGLTSFATVILYDPFYLLDLAVRGVYFNRRHRDEKFADYFATMYGLGGDLSALNYHLYENEQNVHDVCKIPILNTIQQFNMAGTISMLAALDDHPTNRVRIKAMYENLEKELNTNKYLSQELREKALKDLNDIKQLYNDCISPKENFKNGRIGQGLLYFCIRVFVKFKSKAKTADELAAPITASKKDIVKNIISVVQEKNDANDDIGIDERNAAVLAEELTK